MTQREIDRLVARVKALAPKNAPEIDTEVEEEGIISFWYSWRENDSIGMPERRLELCLGNGLCVVRMWFLCGASDYCMEIDSRNSRDAKPCIQTFWHMVTENQ